MPLERLPLFCWINLTKSAARRFGISTMARIARGRGGLLGSMIPSGTLSVSRKLNSLQDRLDWLLNISKAILSFDDAARLGVALPELLSTVLDFDHISLQLYDQETNRLVEFPPSNASAINNAGKECDLSRWPLSWVLAQRKPLVAALDKCRARFSALAESPQLPPCGTYCMVPVAHAQHYLGGLAMVSSAADAWGPEDLHILQSVALSVAEMLTRIQNSGEAEAALRNESNHNRILVEVTNAVISNLDMQKLLNEVANSLRFYFGVKLIVLQLKVSHANSGDAQIIHCLGTENGNELQEIDEEKEPLLESVMTERKVFLAQDDTLRKMASDSKFVNFLLSREIQSVCVLPLISGEKALGLLVLARVDKDGFSSNEIRLLQAVADRLAIAVNNALTYSEISRLKDILANESLYLKGEIKATTGSFGPLIGESAALAGVMERVKMVADSDCSVLIMGETGTGKEMVARAIHNMSSRKDRTMVKVNCAAIPAGLFERDLFGHEKGSFTGAISQKIGRFEFADHSSIFLDEVGEISWELQPKLLRVLQEHEVDRVGGKRVIPIDVRVIAATNCDLTQLVSEHQFRSDLYYRLSTFPIIIPPLRERREDIPALVRHFTQRFAAHMNRTIEYIPEETMAKLSQLPWPGNVRELENVIERAVILTKGPVLQVPLSELKPTHFTAYPAVPPAPIGTPQEPLSRERILQALAAANGVVGGRRGAAVRLGLKRTTLISRMKRLGISASDVLEVPTTPTQKTIQ